ncbi:MAG: hypothetical protein ACPG40_04625 [Alphaproteobacteria bacterium]
MTQAPLNEDHPDYLRTIERLQDSQARLAPFAHQVALENLNSGGLKPFKPGVEAVFGAGRSRGRIDNAPPAQNRLAPLLLRQGAHVPSPLDERDLRLVRLGLHLPDLDGEEGQLLALYLNKQVRSQAVSLVVLSTQLKWLPLLGHLGIGFCAIGDGETVQECCARAAARYDLSKVLDAPTQQVLWARSG